MKTFLKLILIIGIAGYLIFALSKFVSPANESRCTGMTVRVECASDAGDVVVDSTSVARLLARHNIIPDSMLVSDIDLLLVDSLLATDPYIHSARSYVNAVKRLCIDLTVVYPVLRVMDSEGSDYYIDNMGGVLPLDGHYLDVPIVTGHVNRRWAGVYLPRLIDHIASDDYWCNQIEQIDVARDSTVTLVPRTGDIIIRFGHVANIPDKLKRLRLFYQEALPRAGWNHYKEINLEYDNQIICTKNKQHKK